MDWIAHESAHVALGIFDYIGSEVTASDSEPFAYLVGWIFGCIDKVRKYKEVKMAQKIVNQPTLKKINLKRLAKKRKRGIGTGDGGLLTNKMLNRNN